MIYLSGPMTGLPDNNYPKFNQVTAILRDMGAKVYNPAQYQYDGVFPLRKAFSEYSRVICEECTGIMMLPGWEKSKGAKAEHALAVAVGLDVKLWIDMENRDD